MFFGNTVTPRQRLDLLEALAFAAEHTMFQEEDAEEEKRFLDLVWSIYMEIPEGDIWKEASSALGDFLDNVMEKSIEEEERAPEPRTATSDQQRELLACEHDPGGVFFSPLTNASSGIPPRDVRIAMRAQAARSRPNQGAWLSPRASAVSA
jgi:hypothetical protein